MNCLIKMMLIVLLSLCIELLGVNANWYQRSGLLVALWIIEIIIIFKL